MPGGTVRVGIVGAGNNARKRHIPGFLAIPGVEVVAVANRSMESAERVAKEFGITRAYDDWRMLLRDGGTDAILVGTWPYLHAEVTVAALEHGNHVLTEGRLAASIEEARAIQASAAAHPDLVVQVVPTGASLSCDRTIRRLVSERLGDLIAVEGAFPEGGFPTPTTPRHWRERRDLSGINIMSLGRRYESLVRWLPGVVSVSATATTTVTHRPDADTGCEVEVEVPDTVAVIGRYPRGGVLNLLMSKVTGHAPRPAYRIYGSEATIVFDPSSKQVYLGSRTDVAPAEVAIPDHERRGWQVESDFIASIRRGSPVTLTSVAEAMRYMAFTAAVDRSLRSGTWESVAGPGR